MTLSLEEALWTQLESAKQKPEQINLNALLEQIDQVMVQVPETEQLQLAGTLLLRVAELCAIRADLLIENWESAHQDPVIQKGFFSDMVRQTMTVDLTELMEPRLPRKQRTNHPVDLASEPGSIVTTVDKAVVLAMIDQLDQQSEIESPDAQDDDVWAIAHDEPVSECIEAIAHWLQHHPNQSTVSWTTLYQALGLSKVNLWIGLLLGGFDLVQEGEFYSSAIWVKN